MWPGRPASSPRYFQVYNKALYFSADDGVHGRELWRTSHDILQQDQYATELVKDIFPGARGSNPTWLVTMGNYLYFASNGVDTTWMNFDDACGGFRHSSIDSSIAYAISESNIWRPDYVYDCPAGYHWADTEEALYGENAWFTSGWNNRKNGWSPIVLWSMWLGWIQFFRISAGDFSLLRFACYWLIQECRDRGRR